LCFDASASIDANVTIMSDDLTIEPLFAWDASNHSFDTSVMRRQLGVLNSKNVTQGDRKIMTLQTTPQQLRDQVGEWYNRSTAARLSYMSFPNQNFLTTGMYSAVTSGTLICGVACAAEWGGGGKSYTDLQFPAVLQRQIFQDTLRSTKNVALAFQAYYTVIGRLAYYNTLPFFDIISHPSISWRQTAQFAQSYRGFAAVALVSFVHLVLVFLVLGFFLGKTKTSYIGGNAWQTLAQAHSTQMEQIIQSTASMRDGDVRKRLAAAGIDKDVVVLGRLDDSPSGRIGLKKHVK